MKNRQLLLQASMKFKSMRAIPEWLKHKLSTGVQIRLIREALGMTQKQLAERAGMLQGDIANIEEGRRKDLQSSTLLKIADALYCEFPFVLIPKEEIADLVEKKSLEKAKKMVAATSANMAMELQKPSAAFIREQVLEMKEEIVRKRRTLLWEEDEK